MQISCLFPVTQMALRPVGNPQLGFPEITLCQQTVCFRSSHHAACIQWGLSFSFGFGMVKYIGAYTRLRIRMSFKTEESAVVELRYEVVQFVKMALKLKDILDLYEGVLTKEHSNNNCSSAPDALKNIRGAYTAVSSEEDVITVDYNEDNNRYAYIYYFAVCHTFVVRRQAARILLRDRSVYCGLMGYDKEELEMCSLGGGPGCDLIGLLGIRAAVSLGATKRINCTVMDICSGWQKSLTNVFSEFLSSSQGCIYKKKLKVELIRSDLLADPPRRAALDKVASADVLTMVKFVSVVPAENTSDILELIFNRLKPGAYVFFLDNARKSTYNRVASAARKAGLSVVCPEMQFNEATGEEVSSIGPLNMTTKPLKSTSIRSAVWRKIG